MVQQLPAVLIGGPPHAGKSVLLYNLTQALYERGIRHHAIRACPDGEGNWFQEGNPVTVSLIRERTKNKWSDAFIQRISADVAHRRLPFLVDMGGYPGATELPLFQFCTHSILLLRADKPDLTQLWHQMTTEANLHSLAQLHSEKTGTSTISSPAPLLEGTLTGLERRSQTVREDPVFVVLVERIASLFNAYSLHDVEQLALSEAPTQPALDLPVALHAYTMASIQWKPEMLSPFLHSLPTDTPLSVHGWGPNWLYAALAAHNVQQPFHQFDPKLPFGWIQPLLVSITSEAQSSPVTVEKHTLPDATVLSLTFPSGRLEYIQPDPLPFPPVPVEKGLILDGPLPYWLLTALVRLYMQFGVAWLGVHHAQQDNQKTAIVVYSRVETHTIGDLVPLSI